MAHFAELDATNTVLRVIVVADADTADESGIEVESIGAQFCVDLLGGTWVQTSYNNNMRTRYAAVGDTYDSTNDRFIARQPYPSWTLDDNYEWQPPTPRPAIGDGRIKRWDEAIRSWVDA